MSRTCCAASALGVLLALLLAGPARAQDGGTDVLVFTRAETFVHGSIPAGVRALRELGAANDFSVTASDDPAVLEDLAGYEAVVFLSTSGDVLDAPQEGALERYVRDGGGWMGVHAAADTEYEWPFYGTLLAGGWFRSHPPIQPATIEVEDRSHPSTRHLGTRWTRSDEWYAFRSSPRGTAHVLMRMDESSYGPGDSSMGGEHPIAWCRDVGRGRSWFTALGHPEEAYAEPAFRRHLLGGVLSVAGRLPADCTPNERDAPVLTAPPTIARRELRRRGLPVRLACPRGCRATLRLGGLAARKVRLRPGGTVRVRVRPPRGRRLPRRIRLVADVKPDGREETLVRIVGVV